jgi:hypothetical protein
VHSVTFAALDGSGRPAGAILLTDVQAAAESGAGETGAVDATGADVASVQKSRGGRERHEMRIDCEAADMTHGL